MICGYLMNFVFGLISDEETGWYDGQVMFVFCSLIVFVSVDLLTQRLGKWRRCYRDTYSY